MHAHIHSLPIWFTLTIARGSVYQRLRVQCPSIGVILTGDHCTESPFASSGCYPSECHISCDIDRRYSTLLAHTGSCARPKPSRNLGLSPCATSLCRLLRAPAGSWPFPTLSPQSLYGCLDPYPAALLRCSRSFLPGKHRPHLSQKRFGALEPPSHSNFYDGHRFRGCSHSFMFRLPYLLDLQVAPTSTAFLRHRAARPFTPRNERVVTLHEPWYRYIPEPSNWYGGTFTR